MYKGKNLFHLITPYFPSSIGDLSTMISGCLSDGSLECHDDVPKDIRRDLVLESQTGRNSKKADNTPTSGGPYPPVSINVLPAQTARASMVAA